MARFRLSVCKGSDCRANGSEAVFSAAQKEVARLGLATSCRLDRGGCYGLCHEGPNVVVRPDTGRPPDPFSRDNYQLTGAPGEVHHAEVTPEKVIAIIQRASGG